MSTNRTIKTTATSVTLMSVTYWMQIAIHVHPFSKVTITDTCFVSFFAIVYLTFSHVQHIIFLTALNILQSSILKTAFRVTHVKKNKILRLRLSYFRPIFFLAHIILNHFLHKRFILTIKSLVMDVSSVKEQNAYANIFYVANGKEYNKYLIVLKVSKWCFLICQATEN